MEQSSLTVRPNGPPLMATAADVQRLTTYRNALERIPGGGWSISDQRAPAGGDRRALEARLAALALSDSRSSAEFLAARLARLFLRFPHAQIDDKAMGTYVADLIGFPLWVTDRAIMRAIRTPSQHPPSSPTLRGLCEEELAPIRAEVAAIREVLNAQVYHEPTSDERKATQAKFDELLTDLKLNTPLDPLRPKETRPPTRDEATAWLEREAARPSCPPMSPTLRRALNLPEPEIADEAAA